MGAVAAFGGGCDAAWSSLVATAKAPVDLLVDATSVYFIDSTDYTVNRVDRGGGAVSPLAWRRAA